MSNALTIFVLPAGDIGVPPVLLNALTAVERVFKTQNTCVALCAPVLKLYPSVDGNKKSVTQAALFTAVNKELGYGINIYMDANGGTFMQLHPKNNDLHVNPKYCEHGSSQLEYDRCYLTLAIKVIHEVFHGLTNTFYELKGHTRVARDAFGVRKTLMNTPSNLGVIIGKNGALQGDNGFAFEENVLGGRIISLVKKGPLYGRPLAILVPTEDPDLRQSKRFKVRDEDVANAIAWLAAPTKGTLNQMLLYKVSSCESKKFVTNCFARMVSTPLCPASRDLHVVVLAALLLSQ